MWKLRITAMAASVAEGAKRACWGVSVLSGTPLLKLSSASMTVCISGLIVGPQEGVGPLGRMVVVGDVLSLSQAVKASVKAKRKQDASGRLSHPRRVGEVGFIGK